MLRKLDSEAQACYALVISKDGRQCYTCCADGNIIIWDLVSHERIATLKGHEEGASCVDLASDGRTLWTGGLDNAVCTWDIAEKKILQKYDLDSQVRIAVIMKFVFIGIFTRMLASRRFCCSWYGKQSCRNAKYN